MNNQIALFALIFLIIPSLITAEEAPHRGPGVIMGTIIESSSMQPLELANVIIYDRAHRQVTGTATDEHGKFIITGLSIGEYLIEFSFVGLETKSDTIRITPENSILNLGTIKLEPQPIIIQGVEVTAERPPIEFKIDKKVINVKEHYTSQSGTAVDVLQNIPSISVDVQGNVSLRGSTNLRVLIDNRPSILEPSEALQQIPASTIDRIEIITNPSARYDPEGLAGIINVITKRTRQSGINGIANLSLGLDQKYGGDFLLNYRDRNLRIFAGLDYNHLYFPGNASETRETKTTDTTFYSTTEGTSSWSRKFYGGKLGSEYLINPKSRITINFELRKRGMERISEQEFNRWSVPGDTTTFLRDNLTARGGMMYLLNSDYLYNFKKVHKLSARFSFHINDGEDRSMSELVGLDSTVLDGWKSIEQGPMKRLLLNLDYTQPVRLFGGTNGRLEGGHQTTINLSRGGQEIYIYDTIVNAYIYIPEYSHRADFVDNIYAVYSTLGGEIKNFGYQTGIRTEYSYRFLQLSGTEENVDIRRFDIYPTLHLSYKIPPFDQVMASYTRRVNRPRHFDLEPFEVRRDPYSIHKGNPALLPEFVDAFEIGYQRQFPTILFSIDGFYRITRNKIDYLTRVYSGDTLFSTVENIGRDYVYGFEPTFDIGLFRWLNINLSGSFYRHIIEGRIDDVDVQQENQTWSLRNTNTITIIRGTRFQLTSIFNGPEILAQGERAQFFMLNGGVRQEIIPGVLNLTLQVRDILSSAGFDNTMQTNNLYIHQVHERKSPVIIWGLSYNFNNYRADKRERVIEENFDEMENF